MNWISPFYKFFCHQDDLGGVFNFRKGENLHFH